MNDLQAGSVSWKSPSNIALVKYWGKHGAQLPNNPSLSMTLSKSFTTTKIDYQFKQTKGLELEFYFDGKPSLDFAERIRHFLNQQNAFLPFPDRVKLTIHSANTFPHSSGIASSASAFSALALCLVSIGEHFSGNKKNKPDFIRNASFLSRLGSGSACRSVYGAYAVWGAMQEFPVYSDDFATPLAVQVHPVFSNLQDAVLLVSSRRKKVASSAGHVMMATHPFADARYRQAYTNCVELHEVLKNGWIERFTEIVENESLSLHALMMASSPGYLLMQPNTIEIIERIWSFRNETKIPVCFTLDAGPNVHLLYPLQFKKEVNNLIHDELLLFCSDKKWIDDSLGEGPKKLTNN